MLSTLTVSASFQLQCGDPSPSPKEPKPVAEASSAANYQSYSFGRKPHYDDNTLLVILGGIVWIGAIGLGVCGVVSLFYDGKTP